MNTSSSLKKYKKYFKNSKGYLKVRAGYKIQYKFTINDGIKRLNPRSPVTF